MQVLVVVLLRALPIFHAYYYFGFYYLFNICFASTLVSSIHTGLI